MISRFVMAMACAGLLLTTGCESGPSRDELGLPPPEVSFGNSVRGDIEILYESLAGETGRGDVAGFCEEMTGMMEAYGTEGAFTVPEENEDIFRQIVEKLKVLHQQCQSRNLQPAEAKEVLDELRALGDQLPKQEGAATP